MIKKPIYTFKNELSEGMLDVPVQSLICIKQLNDLENPTYIHKIADHESHDQAGAWYNVPGNWITLCELQKPPSKVIDFAASDGAYDKITMSWSGASGFGVTYDLYKEVSGVLSIVQRNITSPYIYNWIGDTTFSIQATNDYGDMFSNSDRGWSRSSEYTLYLSNPGSNSTTRNLRDEINAAGVAYTKFKIVNNFIQPKVISGNLTGYDVNFENNSEVRGSVASGNAFEATSLVKVTNNGYIRGAGANGKNGVRGTDGTTGAASGTRTVNYTKTTRLYKYGSRWDGLYKIAFIQGEYCNWRYLGGDINQNPPYGSLGVDEATYVSVGYTWTGPTTVNGSVYTRGNHRLTNPIEPNLCNYGGGRQWIYDIIEKKPLSDTISGHVGGAGGTGGAAGIGGKAQTFSNNVIAGGTGSPGGLGGVGKRNSKVINGTTEYGYLSDAGTDGTPGTSGENGSTWGNDTSIAQGGNAVTGDSYITWLATGTRNGDII